MRLGIVGGSYMSVTIVDRGCPVKTNLLDMVLLVSDVG